MQRAEVAGIIVGFLLIVLAPMLSEHLRIPGLYVGIAVSLGCIAAALAHAAKKAHLEWRGISPAVGILIGVLPVIGLVGMDYVRSRRTEGLQTEATVVPAAALAARAPAVIPAQSRAAQVSEAQPSTGSHSTLDEERPDHLFDEVSQGLAKARSVIQTVQSATIMIARGKRGDPGDRFTSQLVAAATDLAGVRQSLEQLSGQLYVVLEDTTPLSDLNSALQQYIYAVQAGGAGVTDQGSLRTAASNANQWVAACEQRLAALQASAAPAT